MAALAFGSIALAQDQPQFKSESELVVLHVMVTDRSGAYVSGLPASAFRVLDDTTPQTPQFFLNEDAPVTIGLLIDSSGSMRSVRDRVIAAAAEFVTSSNPQDEIFGLVFNDDVQPVLRGQPFTSDADVLRQALTEVFHPEGRTALYDAVARGLTYVASGTSERRVLVVLSDGGDNASDANLKDVMTLVQTSNTVIYSVALDDPLDVDANPKRLRQLSDASGGESFTPQNVDEVRSAFQKIARDVRHSYTIGYEPANPAPRAGFHKIRIDVKAPDGRRLDVHSRSGYLKGRADVRPDAR
jgi:Ca-activated chloride channel family protein